MGQQHSHSQGEESHGHSHGGEPCHGHGGQQAPPPKQEHGHSHGGKPCHGHGGAQAPPPKQEHGHSHGGKPCHGHGGAQAPPPKQEHGHSHGGKPCHGHGDAAQQQHNHGGQQQGPSDPVLEQRIRALQLFVQTMLFPKMPIVFAKFHEATSNKPPLKQTSTFTIPDNADEFMSAAEFKKFISAYLLGLANYEGHGVVVDRDIVEMSEYFQQKFSNGSISQPEFINVANMVIGRTCITKWEAVPCVFEELGLGFMKLPKIPTDGQTAVTVETHDYAKKNILPFLTEYIRDLLEKHRSEEDHNVKVVDVLKNDICVSLSDPSMSAWKQNVERIPSALVVEEFLQGKEDATVNPALLAHFICTSFIIQMLILQPAAVVDIVAKWGVELNIVKETGELQ